MQMTLGTTYTMQSQINACQVKDNDENCDEVLNGKDKKRVSKRQSSAIFALRMKELIWQGAAREKLNPSRMAPCAIN